MKHSDLLINNIFDSNSVKVGFLSQTDEFDIVTDVLIDKLANGQRLFIAGNGGSASDAQHLAAEFVCKFKEVRPAIHAEALTSDTALITAIANDFGYEYIFTRQLEAKAVSGDVFLAISTSGNSKNIVDALKYCNENEIFSILLTGKSGGEAKKFADISLIANSDNTAFIQDLHQTIYHSLVECVEIGLNLIKG